MEERQISFPIGRRKPRELELTGLAIRGVLVLNNTPAYLYLAPHANPARGDCVVQIEPFSHMSIPWEGQDRLYICDGELVAPLASNEKAVVIWGETPRVLDVARVKRSVEYVLAKALAVKADGTGPGNTSQIHALSVKEGGSAAPANAGVNTAQYVLPGFATHRTLYASTDGAASISRATLEGYYNGAWFMLKDLTPNPAAWYLTVDLSSMALPEFVRLNITPSADNVLNAVIRFDI